MSTNEPFIHRQSKTTVGPNKYISFIYYIDKFTKIVTVKEFKIQ